MGFLRKLFKKQIIQANEPKQEETVEIDMDKLESWIAESNRTAINKITKELSDIWAEFLKEISELQLAIKGLEKTEFEPTDKSYAAINMTKDLFTKKSQLLNKIPKSAGANFSEMDSAHKKAADTIAEAKDANIKQAYVISTYFKKHAGLIIKNLKNIEELLDAFDKKLQAEGGILKLIETVHGKLAERHGLLDKLSEAEKSHLQVSMEINKHNASLDAQKKELDKIGLDPKLAEISQTKEEIEKTRLEIKSIKSGLIDRISSIKRPVKKLIHDSESLVLTREQKSVFLEGAETDDIDAIYSALESLNPLISSKTLNLKENELENIEEIKGKIGSREIAASKDRYKALFEKMRHLDEKYNNLKPIEDEKEQKEEELKSIETDISKAKAEAEKAVKEKNSIKEELEKQKAEITQLVLYGLGREITFVDGPK